MRDPPVGGQVEAEILFADLISITMGSAQGKKIVADSHTFALKNQSFSVQAGPRWTVSGHAGIGDTPKEFKMLLQI